MKRVLSVQDLSCMGKCSLTVALPVLSAMGIGCSVLPTAVLSTHTAFPDPVVLPMTGSMVPMARHMAASGGKFDAVSIGYLSNPEQAEKAAEVLSCFDAIKVIDPAMGDHGKLYSGMTEENVKAMAKLCRKGNVLLPNLTEAALLTGLPYRADADPVYLQELADGMLQFGADGIVITGIVWDGAHTGFVCKEKGGEIISYISHRIPRSQHGTGDMFCAVCTGALALGKSLLEAAKLAAGFVEQVMKNTPASTPFGAEFETCLPWLWQQL